MKVLNQLWGWVVLRGVVGIVFGVLTLLWPGITLAALVLLFGAYALADGVLMIGWAIARREPASHRAALAIGGVLGIAAGVLTFLKPGLTAVALLAVIAVWAVAIGVATIVAAHRLRKVITGEWRLVLAGLLAVALGVILIARPLTGALAMALWIGAYAIVSGVLLIGLGFRLKSWGRLHGGKLASHPA